MYLGPRYYIISNLAKLRDLILGSTLSAKNVVLADSLMKNSVSTLLRIEDVAWFRPQANVVQ